MKFFIMGGTGFIGDPLIRHIIGAGHEVTALARNISRAKNLSPEAILLPGNPLHPGKWQEVAGEADVVINLVGKPIMTRWTKNGRKEILESRILSTRLAVDAIPPAKAGRMTLINANAVGYYEDTGDAIITEKSPPGKGFLSDVCQSWQRETETGTAKGARVIIPRFGAVLGKGGGALAKMLPPFRLGLGGKLGNGKQWFSWIHMDDLVRALLFVAETNNITGVVNMCSPEPVRNLELTQTLSHVLKRPAILPVPGIILKLAMGGSAEIALKGQRVLPVVLKDSGFTFNFPSLKMALSHLLSK